MSKPFARIAVDGEPSLAVLLNRSVVTALGQEVLCGEPRGFSADSAVSLVLGGVGKAYIFDAAAAEAWGAALSAAGAVIETREQAEAVYAGPHLSRVPPPSPVAHADSPTPMDEMLADAVPVKTSATVSNVDWEAHESAESTVPDADAEKAKSAEAERAGKSKRGSKNPRGV